MSEYRCRLRIAAFILILWVIATACDKGKAELDTDCTGEACLAPTDDGSDTDTDTDTDMDTDTDTDTDMDTDTDTDTDGDTDGDTDSDCRGEACLAPTDEGTDTASEIAPIDLVSRLEGESYFIHPSSGYWNKPNRLLGNELGGRIPPFVFQFSSITPTDTAGNGTFVALFGIGREDGTQDMCDKTFEMTGTLTTSARGETSFAFDPFDLRMIIYGNDEDSDAFPTALVVPVHSFSIGGTLVDRTSDIKQGIIRSELDFRDVACLFAMVNPPTADNLCSMIARDYEVECSACSYDGGDGATFCIPLGAEAFKVDAVLGLTIVPVADFDEASCIVDTCTNSQSVSVP